MQIFRVQHANDDFYARAHVAFKRSIEAFGAREGRLETIRQASSMTIRICLAYPYLPHLSEVVQGCSQQKSRFMKG